jgi:hypothetical protein
MFCDFSNATSQIPLENNIAMSVLLLRGNYMHRKHYQDIPTWQEATRARKHLERKGLRFAPGSHCYYLN